MKANIELRHAYGEEDWPMELFVITEPDATGVCHSVRTHIPCDDQGRMGWQEFAKAVARCEQALNRGFTE